MGSGAVTAAGGRLLVLTAAGELLAGPASPEGFTPSGRAQVLSGKCWTVPVLAQGRLYCRNARGDALCLDLRKKVTAAPPMNPNRRQFLRTAAIASAGSLIAPQLRAAASAKIWRTALIGCGWWGQEHPQRSPWPQAAARSAPCATPTPPCWKSPPTKSTTWPGPSPKPTRTTAIFWPATSPTSSSSPPPTTGTPFRPSTPSQGGAHVYVEKPTAHTVNESRAMVRAARASGRTVQVGLHRRVGPHYTSARQFLKSGGAGRVGMVRLFAHYGGGPERPALNSEPPEGLDWDLWSGPAPLRPFNTKIHPGGWRSFLDYANGQIGDWGVHWLDQVLSWTEERYPKRVYSTAGRPVRGPAVRTDKEQTSDAPDHQVAVYEFEGFTAVWENRSFAENRAEKHQIGAYFYGDKGTLHIGWKDGWTFHPSSSRQPEIHENAQLQEPDGHNIKLLWTDFLDAIDQNRRPRRRHRARPPRLGAGHARHALLAGGPQHLLGRRPRADPRRPGGLGPALPALPRPLALSPGLTPAMGGTNQG